MATHAFLDDLNPPGPVEPYGFPARDAVCARLVGMTDELRGRGVTSLSLFGSVARGEADEGSDIDVVIDTQEGFYLDSLASVTCLLEERMGTKVDVITRGILVRPRFPGMRMSEGMREAILHDCFPVF